MRTTTASTRAAAVALAAALGMANPLTAVAQTGDATAKWAPPAVNMSYLPNDSGQPDKPYVKKTECVTHDQTLSGVLRDRPWSQDYLQIDQAQKLVQASTGGMGTGKKVAVIDTGVARHPYLKVQGGGDYVHPDNGLEDCDGHGTEVAGIIAASTPTDIGFKGVAPDATIVSIRQTSQNYSVGDQSTVKQGSRQQGDGAGNLLTLAQAIVHAANLGGISVANISIDNCRTAGGGISAQEKALQAAIHYAVEKNIVIVAAAGNTSDACKQNEQADADSPQSIVTPPWFSDDVLSVAAIQEDGSVANFSMRGPWVSVAAPGTNITSLDPSSSGLANQVVEGGKAGGIQGTSFAAPYVAGLATLVRAQFPNLNARQVMRRIEATAQHPGAPGGHDQYIGYGVVDPIAALTAIVPAEEGLSSPPPKQLPSGLPPATPRDWAPMIVALAGTGGGLAVLLVTMFVVRTIRRNRRA
ncbi:type VII secretion-associated serine protease mycosin [Amycolatopsis pigmentata]|uniref:Type VII secretion-associated serine protease mycosin n=1 Tax=Amycolatopsis pigmentata TaxID=450801 RepID=A0ABW5G5Y6_9PSEU